MRYACQFLLLFLVAMALACGGITKPGLPNSSNEPSPAAPIAETPKPEQTQPGTELLSADGSLELRPMKLMRQFQVKNVPVQLSCVGKHQVPDKVLGLLSVDMTLEAQLDESTETLLPGGGARFKEEFQAFKYDVQVNKAPLVHGEILQKPEGLTLSYQEDNLGTFGSKQVHTTGAALKMDRGQGLITMNDLGLQLLRGFEMLSMVAPNAALPPGTSWKSQRRLPIPLLVHVQAPLMDVTYTYQGIKRSKRPAVALVSLSGTMHNATQSGTLKGTVWFDLETGAVVEGKAVTELTMTLDQAGVGGKGPADVTGTLEIKLRRGKGIE